MIPIAALKLARQYFLEIGEGKRRLVRKAEGVAIDPECGRVYVVSDRDARLYVFKLAAVG